MPQSSSRNGIDSLQLQCAPSLVPHLTLLPDLTSDLFDFAPEQFFDNDPLSSEYRLFEQSEGTTSFAMSHLGGIAGSMTVLPGSNGTVSPQDIWTEPLSAPPSAALTNLSTPGTTFESPYAVHSAETSPLMHADPVEDNNEWTSLFPGEHSPIEEDIEPSVERATALMSRATSSSGQNASTTLRHSSVVGIKSRRRDKPLPPIVRDPHDAPDIAKRKRNTEAARKSRAKRQNAMEALQSQVEDLQYQVYHWRTVAETGHAPLEPFDFSKADQVP
ncbi:MAG: hypothetical protein MMC23_009450 [Stictis urceolatum]|nr:hypothetical protein [Stictis urceolata]